MRMRDRGATPLAASRRASRAAASSRSFASTTASTRPRARALDGRTRWPVRMWPRLSRSPISRARRWVLPAPGSSPSWTSGSANTVFGPSIATRARQTRITSRPPPRAAPATAATNGFGLRSTRSSEAWPCRDSSRAAEAVVFERASRSAPARKFPVLPLARTQARTPESSAMTSRACSRSDRDSRVRTLTGLPGVSNVMIATPSGRFSIRKVFMSRVSDARSRRS